MRVRNELEKLKRVKWQPLIKKELAPLCLCISWTSILKEEKSIIMKFIADSISHLENLLMFIYSTCFKRCYPECPDHLLSTR